MKSEYNAYSNKAEGNESLIDFTVTSGPISVPQSAEKKNLNGDMAIIFQSVLIIYAMVHGSQLKVIITQMLQRLVIRPISERQDHGHLSGWQMHLEPQPRI